MDDKLEEHNESVKGMASKVYVDDKLEEHSELVRRINKRNPANPWAFALVGIWPVARFLIWIATK